MLQFDGWKRMLIWAVCLFGLVMAAPNGFYTRVEQHNDAVQAIEIGEDTPEQQALKAQWPDYLPSSLVNLGLDLRGGAHLLAEVKVEDVYTSRMDAAWPEIRDALRPERATIGTIRKQPSPADEVRVKIGNPDSMPQALAIVRDLARPVQSLTGVGANDIDVSAVGDTIFVALSDAEKTATDERTMQQSLEIVRRRIDEVGTREPTIQRQGTDRILIQVPGIGSAAELKAIIGTTARLTFNPVVNVTGDANANAGIGNMLLASIDTPGQFFIVEAAPVVSGEDLVDAQPAFDQNGRPAVSIFASIRQPARDRFGDYTADNIGSPFAIVLDSEVDCCAPSIQSPTFRADRASSRATSRSKRSTNTRGVAARGRLACGTGIPRRTHHRTRSGRGQYQSRASGLHRGLCGCADLYVPQLWHIRHFR